jgi:hypothetical protein
MPIPKLISALILFYYLMTPEYSIGQAPEIVWQNTIGGSGNDNLYSMQQTNDGGYILGGSSWSLISGDKTETSWGGEDYWVVKLNSSGAIEWQNTIGGNGDDRLLSIQQTIDGGYILGGYSLSGISGDKTEASIGDGDYWVVKLNSSGSIEWQNTIGGGKYDYLVSLCQTTDGGYILGGASTSGISGDKTEARMGPIGTYDYWVVKLNGSGAIEWQNTIGGSSNDWMRSIKQTSDGGYILGGYSDSGISGDKTEALIGATYYGDYWIVKINSSGAIEWQNTIGGSDDDLLFTLQQTIDGGYILGGYSLSGISGDKTETSWGGNDYWVVKLNSSGTIEWQNTIGGSEDDLLSTLQQTIDEGYILGGYSLSGISGDKTESSLGSEDYWVLKLNSSGVIEWQNTIGGNSNDLMYFSLEQTTDGGYILGGESSSGISGDKTEASQGSLDYWVVKLEPDCTPTAEICNTLDDNCNGLIDEDVTIEISITAGGSTTFCSGGSVLLTASHNGTSVQWFKNGLTIAGATSTSYTATATGTYTCQTTSPCGVVLSTGIAVTVNKKPTATISAGGPTTFCAGGSVVLTANAGAGLGYQWYKGASPIIGATSISYTATTTGNYKCRVTRTATGCYKDSNKILVTVSCREGSTQTKITTSPNPTSGLVNLSFENPLNPGEIFVSGIDGRILSKVAFEGNVQNIQIDLSAYQPGLYNISIMEVSGLSTYQVIKVD